MNYRSRKYLVRRMQSKDFRHEYVAQHNRRALADFIRNIREAQQLSQGDLAARMGKHQTHVSRIENPNYGRMTLRSILEILKELDVALFLDVVPFSAFTRKVEQRASQRLYAEPFDDQSEKSKLESWVEAARIFEESTASTTSSAPIIDVPRLGLQNEDDKDDKEDIASDSSEETASTELEVSLHG